MEVFATILGMLMNCFNAREGLVTFPTVPQIEVTFDIDRPVSMPVRAW